MITKPVIAAAGASGRLRWTGLILAVAVGAGMALLPTPAALSRIAHLVLAIAAFAIVMWVFQVMNNGIVSVLMMGLMILAGVRPALALSAFAGAQFWILLAVLYYGFAMQKTGLAQRLSYYILSLFPPTYQGILWAFFLIGLVLALGIPSTTVRAAIMLPVAWALVQTLGLGARSRGTALIMLTVVEMAVFPGLAFLYGSLNGLVVEAMFEAKQLPLSWGGYGMVMTLPTLLMSSLMVLVNPLVLKPEAPLKVSADLNREQLRAMGPIKWKEWVTAAIIVVSIAFWATGSIHDLPTVVVGMFGLALLGLTGIVADADIAGGISWTLLLFLGGVFSLAAVLQELKLTDWLAGYIVPMAGPWITRPLALVLGLVLAMLLLRFLDPSGFIAISVLFLPLADSIVAAGISPMVVMAALLLASAPFWATYENFWVAMGEGITFGQAYSAGQRVRLASAYAGICLVTVAVSVPFWKWIGVL